MVSALAVAWLCLAQDPTILTPGVTFHGEVHALTKPRVDFEFEIQPGSVFLKLRVIAQDGDVDLFCGVGDPPDNVGAAELSSIQPGGFEELVIDRLSIPAIESGTWWCSVVAPDEESFGSGDGYKPKRTFTLETKVVAARTDAILQPGKIESFTLEPERGGFCTFRIEVPKGAGALRIDLHGASADLDLFLSRNAPLFSILNSHMMARHEWGAETLLLSTSTKPSLVPGTWFVDVMDAQSADMRTPFQIRAAFDPAPPPEWSTPPRLVVRDERRPLSRAICGTLEVFCPRGGGGSATLVTPDGLLLTNAHVVDRGDQKPLDEVVLAASLDPRSPAVEAFRGSVLRFDATLDLALIQIDRGFYGTPLGGDYRFPFVELGRDDAVEIGDPLWVVGYPILGGSGSRVSIHCTRGVISGFDRGLTGQSFKTDAAMIPGNSGGAALDERGHLIGVPSATISDENGSIGLVTPISVLPAEWRALLDARLKRK